MKVFCFGVLALLALVAGDDLLAKEIHSDLQVSNELGPYSQQFVYLRANPEHEPSPADLERLEEVIDRSLIADVIKNTLDEFRDVVINGNDDLPPLDPLVLNNIGPYEFTVTGVRAKGEVTNFRAEGLRWYVVDYVTFNALRLDLGVHVTLPWFTVTGSYDAEVRLALLVTHKAGGNFRIFLNRFEVGVAARLGTNLLGGHLVLRELDIKLDIHDTFIQIDGMTGSSIINSFISSYIQNLTQEIVQAEMANVSQMLSEELFDTINDLLKDYTLADILG